MSTLKVKRNLAAIVTVAVVCLCFAGIVVAAEPVITLKKTSKTFHYNGASGSVRFLLTGAPGSQMTVNASAPTTPWLTVDANSQSQTFTLNRKGTAKGAVKYTVMRYDMSAPGPRQGTIQVGDNIFTVFQTGVPCRVSISSAKSHFDESGGTGSFAVTAPQGCDWTVATATSIPWIGVFENSSGSGPGTVAFTVSSNHGEKRTGKLLVTTVSGKKAKSHTVSQTKRDASSGSGNSGNYVIFAWNDLGMHCLNPTYDDAVILPPYNTIWAQVVRVGDSPQVVTDGVEVDYRIVDNTFSYGKRSFGQFWDNMLALFGAILPHDKGLNLEDPTVNNGLSGTMLAKGDHFQANGIPVTPVLDDGTWNPYQVAEVTVRDKSTGALLAQTRTTVPTSDEIRCDGCHGVEVASILAAHDVLSGTTLQNQRPVLCASCHASPALGSAGMPGRKYLSQSVHSFHGNLPPASQPECYNCHPGQNSKCNRSLRHTAADGNCVTCHGTLAEVGSSIASGRVPWVNEPSCATCHGGTSIPEVSTGTTLYRNAIGHGGMRCSACHGSPHAIVPSSEQSDNYQALVYQGKAVTIGSCAACHENSRGESLDEFQKEHGGSHPEHRNACHICHAAISSTPTLWPHGFKWLAR